jgi:hypothetical protein
MAAQAVCSRGCTPVHVDAGLEAHVRFRCERLSIRRVLEVAGARVEARRLPPPCDRFITVPYDSGPSVRRVERGASPRSGTKPGGISELPLLWDAMPLTATSTGSPLLWTATCLARLTRADAPAACAGRRAVARTSTSGVPCHCASSRSARATSRTSAPLLLTFSSSCSTLTSNRPWVRCALASIRPISRSPRSSGRTK